MGKKLLLIAGLIAAGILSYYGGYRAYVSVRPKTEEIKVEALRQKSPYPVQRIETEEYYIGKIEQELLMIYKMPGMTVYDSIEISTLDFYGTEEDELLEGKIFADLTEVFEFLENSMS